MPPSTDATDLGSMKDRGRLRRKKDATAFNILVVGSKGCGKTSFIEFLRTSLKPYKKQREAMAGFQPASNPTAQSGAFTPHYSEVEVDGERIGLTLHDSKGLENHVVDLQLREITSFLESKFEETFNEEQKFIRSTGVKDTHIHCVLVVLDPRHLDANIANLGSKTANGLDSPSCLSKTLDIDLFRMLQGKTTVIPVIAKADTVTTTHMAFLKRSISDTINKLDFDPFEMLRINVDEVSDEDTEGESSTDEEVRTESFMVGKHVAKGAISKDTAEAESVKTGPSGDMNDDSLSLPMSILSPDLNDPSVVGRQFPWGFADPYNPIHTNFNLLKESLLKDWRDDLIGGSRMHYYEAWRTSRLKKRTVSTRSRVTSSESRVVSGSEGGFEGDTVIVGREATQ